MLQIFALTPHRYAGPFNLNDVYYDMYVLISLTVTK